MAAHSRTAPRRGTVEIPAGDETLTAVLALPSEARGLILLASGSSTAAVADELFEAGFASLILDVRGCCEAWQFIGGLAWLDRDAVVGDLPPSVRRLPVGCFATGAAAAAALIAAAERPDRVCAVVTWQGRTDLAAEVLPQVGAPTLLIVDQTDAELLRVNRQARSALGGEVGFVPVRGPEVTGRVAALARDWFLVHLPSPRSAVWSPGRPS
jgi:hypothetical protein